MTNDARTILIVDDNHEIARSHGMLLEDLGFNFHIETDARKVEDRLEEHPEIELLLLDLDLQIPGWDGLDVLARVRVVRPQVGVIMATVINDIAAAVKATKSGAYNYLLKPLNHDRLKATLAAFFESKPPGFGADPSFSVYITQAPAFEPIFHRVRSFASAEVPILIGGETGTGKELIAHLIHSLSPQRATNFVPVNIAAFNENLFDSELFGHVKGAFTGAAMSRWGYFHKAGAGSLFLDEIGELDLALQKKLLRVLQTKKYSRLGETDERPLDARLIFATNRNLREEVAKGRFREDLYFRLSSYQIDLPPLRDRPGDVALLSRYFLEKYRVQFGRKIKGLAPETLKALESYHFPGNIRELEGLISSAVLLETQDELTPDSLPDYTRFTEPEENDLERSRYKTVMEAMAACDGNQTRAAKRLKIARSTLNRMLKQYREKGYRCM